jgi:hypothetical protein
VVSTNKSKANDKDEEAKAEANAEEAKAAPPAKLTDDLDLGPGVVVTPGYEVPEAPKANGGVAFSDRRIHVRENPQHAVEQARLRFTAEADDVEITSEAQKARTSETPDKK